MAVLQLAALHILAANVEDEINIRAEMGRCLIVGDRFYFT